MQLLPVMCLLGAALAAPAERQKRDILPGDPRYGTDYHHHHHEHHDHHHDNQVEARHGARGFSDSYASAASKNLNNAYLSPNNQYGPPDFIPGKPVNNQYLSPLVERQGSSDSTFNSYGAPVADFKTSESEKLIFKPPVFSASKTQENNFASSSSSSSAESSAQGSGSAEQEVVKSTQGETHNSAEEKNTQVKAQEVSSGSGQTISFSGFKSAPIPAAVDFSSSSQGIPQGSSAAFGAFGHSLVGFPSGYDSSPVIRSGFAPSPGSGYYGGFNNFPSGFDSGFPQGIPVRTINTHVPVEIPQPYTVQFTRNVPYTFQLPFDIPGQWSFIPSQFNPAAWLPNLIPAFPGGQGSASPEQPASSSTPDQSQSGGTTSVETTTNVETSAAKAPSQDDNIAPLIPSASVPNRSAESVDVGNSKAESSSSASSGSQQLVDANGAYIY